MTRPSITTPLAVLMTLLVGAGCSSLPEDAPPLADMVEPLELLRSPDDEAQRERLPAGGFTGLYVADAADTLEAALGDAEGVEVVRVVENGPADIAEIQTGDLLIQARVGDAPATRLDYTSQWRALELRAKAGERIEVVFDRAGRRARTSIEVQQRLRAPERGDVERLREEQRIGVVVRTATEVEARAGGLAPGAGAVIVGLSKRSPLRHAGLQFGDLLVALGERSVDHPQVVLDAIRAADETLAFTYVRDGNRTTVDVSMSERASELREVWIPPLLTYSSERGNSSTSILLGLFGYESTETAWRTRLLWLFSFSGGDASELLEDDE